MQPSAAALNAAPNLSVFDLLAENATLRARQRFIWGLVAALALHALIVWLLPRLPQKPIDPGNPPSIVVRLNPPPVPSSVAEPSPTPVEPSPTPPKIERRIITSPTPRPNAPVIPTPPEPTPQPIEVPPARPEARVADPKTDMFAAIQARRADREAQAAAQRAGAATGEPSAEDRRNAAIQRNLATLNAGYGGTSGVFEILSKGSRHASFSFRGWKGNTSQHKWRQVIEVDAGQGGDVELAIVRRMIELIREHYKEDFNWESQRLGRVVVLSARLQDNSGLEAFLMREFFAVKG